MGLDPFAAQHMASYGGADPYAVAGFGAAAYGGVMGHDQFGAAAAAASVVPNAQGLLLRARGAQCVALCVALQLYCGRRTLCCAASCSLLLSVTVRDMSRGCCVTHASRVSCVLMHVSCVWQEGLHTPSTCPTRQCPRYLAAEEPSFGRSWSRAVGVGVVWCRWMWCGWVGVVWVGVVWVGVGWVGICVVWVGGGVVWAVVGVV